ncbi:MAG: phosphoadenosine phosphosulfate reductase family protein [Nitrosopumilaceae archaeon]|jgi:phosphoadenosine phosphosulfate reductase
MLIQCDKHTQQDLEIWDSYEEADLIYYNNHNMVEKEQKAIDTIINFDSDYVSTSWGKDSTVLVHLCYRAQIKIPLVWIIVKDIVNPYCFDVRNYFLKTYNVNYYEITESRWYDGNRYRATGVLENGFKKAVKQFGKKYISGVRAEESGIRKMLTKIYGVKTEKTCRPLAYWKQSDIFAYLAHYQLPVHPNYGMLGGGRYNREHIRVASLGIKRGDAFDKLLWEKEYYQNELNKIGGI